MNIPSTINPTKFARILIQLLTSEFSDEVDFSVFILYFFMELPHLAPPPPPLNQPLRAEIRPCFCPFLMIFTHFTSPKVAFVSTSFHLLFCHFGGFTIHNGPEIKMPTEGTSKGAGLHYYLFFLRRTWRWTMSF